MLKRGSQDLGSMDEDNGKEGVTRVAKACEPCRLRKTRCDIATQLVCSECLKRDLAGDCKIREKARPNRPTPQIKAKKKRALSISDTASPPQHLDGNAQAGPSRIAFAPLPEKQQTVRHGRESASVIVERLLEEQGSRRHGLTLSVAMAPESIYDKRASYLGLGEIGLTPGDPLAVNQAHQWINTHFRAIHHNTPFLNLTQVLDIATRLFGPHQPPISPIGNDELALLFAILALGSLREQTFDSQTGRYRDQTSGSVTSPANLPPSFRSSSMAQSLFRLAQEEMDNLEESTETAVQALFLMHTFVSNTSMGRRSRDYIARAVMMAHEVGLNRTLPLSIMRRDRYDLRRRAMIYLYVYFADVYLSALESRPPLIKRHDYDRGLFDAIDRSSASGIDTPSGTPLTSLRSFVDLVTTIGRVLEQLHTSNSEASSVDLVLRLEVEMEDLRERLGPQTFDVNEVEKAANDASRRAATAGSLLRQIHYNWQVESRIALRAPFLRDPLLKHSSLVICARSAMSILHFHRKVIRAGLLNLPWTQLRRVTTSIYLVFIALWVGEVTDADAEAAVNNALDVLAIIGTRWKSAGHVSQVVVQLAEKSGISYRQPSPMRDELQIPNMLSQLADAAIPSANMPQGFWSMPDLSNLTDQTIDPVSQFFDLGDFTGEISSLGADVDDIFAGWQTTTQMA